jgi:hypothetical protein
MSYGELYLPPERPQYNTRTGHFFKGHVPHNKGKKWDEWMSKRGQRRVRKGWVNLSEYRPKKRPDNSERCRIPVVAVRDDGTWCVLSFVGMAGEWVGGNRENVRRCCQFNRRRHVNKKTGAVNTDHKYMGIRFYYESDPIWMQKIKP